MVEKTQNANEISNYSIEYNLKNNKFKFME